MIDVGQALRPGATDPISLLVLRCARKLAFLVLWIGLSVLVTSHSLDDPLIAQISGPTGIFKAAGTPLFGVAMAIVLRLAVGVIALVLAAVVAMSVSLGNHSIDREPWNRRLADRWQMTGMLRSLRWTFAVRAVATERAGRAGRVLVRCETALGVLTYLAFAVFIVLFVVES